MWCFFGRGVKSPFDFTYDLPRLSVMTGAAAASVVMASHKGLRKPPTFLLEFSPTAMPAVILLMYVCGAAAFGHMSSSTCPDWWRCGGRLWPKHEGSTTLIDIIAQKIDFWFLLTGNLFLLLYLPWNICIFANCWLVFMLWCFIVSGYLFTELLYLRFPDVVCVHLLIPILWYACYSQCCVGLIFFPAFSSVEHDVMPIIHILYYSVPVFTRCLSSSLNV